MGRRKKYGVSFSWKRASGLSAAKGRLSRKTGVPLTRSGRQRKGGRGLGCCILLVILIAGPFVVVLTCLPVCAQSRGTFSASELAGMGTGSAAREKEQPILTKDTLDVWLQQQVSQLQIRLRAAKKGSLSPRASGVVWIEKSKRYQFRSRTDREIEIKRLEKELTFPVLPSLNPFDLKVGQIGTLSNWGEECRVLQIVDQKTSLIHAVWHTHDTRFFLNSAIVADLQEGQNLKRLRDTLVVEGARQYKTALGAISTVPVLCSYDLQTHLAKLATQPKDGKR